MLGPLYKLQFFLKERNKEKKKKKKKRNGEAKLFIISNLNCDSGFSEILLPLFQSVKFP